MLALVSPAKKLDGATPPPTDKTTHPALQDQSEILFRELGKLDRTDLRRLMKISPSLADLAFERHQRLGGEVTLSNAKQALFAFRGDTYVGLDADSLSAGELAFAQDHLRILSGLYGVLRPFDLIQPYRLEMGTKLANPRGEDLHDFWGGRIAEAVNAALAKAVGPVINLASKQYFSAVVAERLEAEVITPVFKDGHAGTYRVLGMFAKRARGMMARYMIRNRLRDADALKDFSEDGYRYSKEASGETEFVFLRDRN